MRLVGLLSSYFAHDARSQEPEELNRICCDTSGWFLCVWILYTDVSEQYVCSIFEVGVFTQPVKMEQGVPEGLHIKFISRGITQMRRIQNSQNVEILESINLIVFFMLSFWRNWTKFVSWGDANPLNNYCTTKDKVNISINKLNYRKIKRTFKIVIQSNSKSP